MAIKPGDRNWGSNNKTFNYLGKDFATIRQNIIDFTKTYFPNQYSDFNESSPGMVFIEQASAIGDMLAFYQDTQLKESMLAHATERKNVLALAKSMGYKPKVTSPALVKLSVYQLVPATGAGLTVQPDSDYYLRIKEGMLVSGPKGVTFRTTELLDFNSDDEREYQSVFALNQGAVAAPTASLHFTEELFKKVCRIFFFNNNQIQLAKEYCQEFGYF